MITCDVKGYTDVLIEIYPQKILTLSFFLLITRFSVCYFIKIKIQICEKIITFIALRLYFINIAYTY